MNSLLPGCALLLISTLCPGAEFFVAPDGNDTNAGTIEKPFATVQHAHDAANAGDTVFLRGGTYAMREERIATKGRLIASITNLTKSGTADKPIRYWAYKEEKPVFDCSAVKPQSRIDAFTVTGSWIHLKGIEVTGVQVTLKGHTQSIAFHNEGSHNIYEQLRIHDGQAIGIYSVKGGDNLFLNCDAYNNRDYTSEDGKGGNVDGFGCHPPKGSTGNVFRGCRAWFNSDDGFDCINSHESVTFENCWAMYNGLNAKGEKLADGNGFKAGGYGSTPADRTPNPPPRHVVRFCLAVGNRSSGFYSNHHLGGSDWTSNTAFRNGANFNMLCREKDNKTDIDGFGHKLRNNLAYKSRNAIVKFDASKCDSANNSWDLKLELSDKDFLSTDEKELTQPRQSNGDLPAMKFMHLADGSATIDRGVDSGFPFKGVKPDLGAFERQ